MATTMKYCCALSIAILMVLTAGCVIISNRLDAPKEFEEVPLLMTEDNSEVTVADTLTIMTWNIGYAGMGKEADFFMDGGTQYRPTSKDLLYKNLDGIASHLVQANVDIMLLQEVAKTSWLTRQTNILDALQRLLPDYHWTYSDDLRTRWIPWPLRIRIGNATATRFLPKGAETRALPLEKHFTLGIFRKQYRMHIIRIEPDWVIVNVHLSAFDSAQDSTREEQLRSVLDFAQAEYGKGNKVLVGGDWNLKLIETDFPHATDEEHLFWIRTLPLWARPEGWQWVTDDAVPSVRTAHQPYEVAENYTLVIDGFLVSPNIELVSVSTDNLHFSFSDHHPVTMVVRSKRNSNEP